MPNLFHTRKFKLEIELGNDSMQCLLDLRGVLQDAARDLLLHAETNENAEVIGGSVRLRDRNGNVVGKWEIIND